MGTRMVKVTVLVDSIINHERLIGYYILSRANTQTHGSTDCDADGAIEHRGWKLL